MAVLEKIVFNETLSKETLAWLNNRVNKFLMTAQHYATKHNDSFATKSVEFCYVGGMKAILQLHNQSQSLQDGCRLFAWKFFRMQLQGHDQVKKLFATYVVARLMTSSDPIQMSMLCSKLGSPSRKDREDRSGGGLLIALPSNISAQQIPIQIQQTRELEILAIKIHVRNISFYIVNIYAPRGFNIIIIKSFLESLMAPMIIFGDFNLHHPMWGSDHISRYSNEFVEWITDSNLVLNTTVPTYRSSADATSLIDLTVCSSSISVDTAIVMF
ncbi:replication-associated protein [Trichonephila clavipes]|nr:replication-associated protein [Trichonephila clavipes]